MKYLIYITNILLILLIPVVFFLAPIDGDNDKRIKTAVNVKKVNTSIFNGGVIAAKPKEEVKEEVVEEKNEIETDKNSNVNNKTTKAVANTRTNTVNKTTTRRVEAPREERRVTDVLETKVGKMSGYGPDCRGCSGYLATGRYVGNGNIYYGDKKYGNVRIVAGDYSYKFGTIVRIKNSRAGNNIIAIVLDRGSNIGIGKKFLFDLLYPSSKEAAKDEVSYNVTFEILRYGY